jgi:hypothetical protein
MEAPYDMLANPVLHSSSIRYMARDTVRPELAKADEEFV